MTTLASMDASRMASRREDRVVQADQIRAAAVADALALILAGQPGRAHYRLMRGWRDQATCLGLGYAGIPGQPYSAAGPLPGGAEYGRPRPAGRHERAVTS